MDPQGTTTIFRSDLGDHSYSVDAQITEFEYLASYSWHESDIPTISVPGFPPLWTPPVERPLQLEADSGRVYVDQNTARIPQAPLEPVFQALAIQSPTYDVGKVDMVTDRNNIRKLLRFLDGSSSESFQIQAEVVDGKTVLLRRMDNGTTRIIQGFQGYGRSFEKACTKSSVETSGYYRITSFRFGGLRCMVRHETDGYIGNEAGEVGVEQQAKTTKSLSQLLENLQLVGTYYEPSHTPKLTVKREGHEVDSSSIIEIKTRAFGKSLDMNEATAQLWISQIPYLATAYHNYGKFHDIEVRDMTEHVRTWEKSNQKVLGGLANLLNRIVEAVKDSANQSALIRYEGGMKLEVIPGEQKNTSSDGTDPFARVGKQNIEDNNQIAKTITPSRTKVKITIGNERYEVDVSGIPRFATLVPKNGDNATQSTEFVHEAIPLFDIALKGVESGYRQCFRLMSVHITAYQTLCNTYELLQVDVCKGRTLSDIIKDLKAGQEYDEVRDRSKARDAAFKLVYCMLQDTFRSNDKHKNAIFNAVLFVASHPGTFKRKTRNAVRATYEHMFVLSTKQRANLDKWHKLDFSEHADTDDDDHTTEEDDQYWYDSDCSDYW
ncbi:hypothetical protein FB567DRAFT_625376 [Paraphoma chrysanthemicola]|uniref:Geranylgeranyl pyrophosphate synthetase n=1 Tax=Paraphoma chrysanthemicola TaxID=798071 RepID=A0A8K0W2C1_9PLEO|nr:hypothetical protein FB567DRAFT_625376 [Paraphoma chrysanthemicola]